MSQTTLDEVTTLDATDRVACCKADSFVSFLNPCLDIRNAAHDSGEYLTESTDGNCPAGALFGLLTDASGDPDTNAPELPGMIYDPDSGGPDAGHLWEDNNTWYNDVGTPIYALTGTPQCVSPTTITSEHMWYYEPGATIADGQITAMQLQYASGKPQFKRIVRDYEGNTLSETDWIESDSACQDCGSTPSGNVVTLEGGRFCYLIDDGSNFGYHVFDAQTEDVSFYDYGSFTYDLQASDRIYKDGSGRGWYIAKHTDNKHYFIRMDVNADGTFSLSRSGTALEDQGVTSPGLSHLYRDNSNRWWVFDYGGGSNRRDVWEVPDISARAVGDKHVLEQYQSDIWWGNTGIINDWLIAEYKPSGPSSTRVVFYEIDTGEANWDIYATCAGFGSTQDPRDFWSLQDGYFLADLGDGSGESTIHEWVAF